MVALVEQPFLHSRLLGGPASEFPGSHQPFGSPPREEVHCPGGIGRRRAAEVPHQGADLLIDPGGLVQGGKELCERSHNGNPSATAAPASPVGVASLTSSSVSPSKRVCTARASTPRSDSQRTTGPVKPCVTQTSPAPLASMA